MINRSEILQTIAMIDQLHLDIRIQREDIFSAMHTI